MCNDRLLDKINSEIYKMVQDDNVNNIKLVDISKDGGIQTGITHEYGCDSTEKVDYFSFDVIATTFAMGIVIGCLEIVKSIENEDFNILCVNEEEVNIQ